MDPIQKVEINSEKIKIAGNLSLPEKPTDGVLLLHGAGQSTKKRFIELQHILYDHHVASFAIDFPGVGESGGLFSQGSLALRLKIAADAFSFFQKYIPCPQVLGSSMGGHIACRLLSVRRIKKLILLYPAAYGAEGENKKLDASFTEFLRKKDSWRDSLAFFALKKFRGSALVIFGQNDEVIPGEIQQTFKRLISGRGRFIIIPQAPHTLLKENKRIRQLIYTEILQFLSHKIRT